MIPVHLAINITSDYSWPLRKLHANNVFMFAGKSRLSIYTHHHYNHQRSWDCTLHMDFSKIM